MEKLYSELFNIRNSLNRKTFISIVNFDFNNLSGLEECAKLLFLESIQHSVAYATTLYINNAGTLGDLKYIGKDNSSVFDINNYLQTNLTSNMYLVEQLMSYYFNKQLNTDALRVVNISSLAAIQPTVSWGLYSTVKAAKEMFFQTLALEHANDAAVRVLNYAPGPLDTNVSDRLMGYLRIM